MDPIRIFQQLSKWPMGRHIFSLIVGFKAPYFLSIQPLFLELNREKCRLQLKKRWFVLNHIGTVHAIAMCNACELAMGMTMQAGLARDLRWIPKGMTVEYLKKAETDLEVVCDFPEIEKAQPGDIRVPVVCLDKKKIQVMRAEILVYISKKS